MRTKRRINDSSEVPFDVVRWHGLSCSVITMLAEGWEITHSSQTNWRVQSRNEYYYFRQPESKMLIRVTWLRNQPMCFDVKADFMCHEKYVGHKFRKFRHEEALIISLDKTDAERVREIVETDDMEGRHWLEMRDNELLKQKLDETPTMDLMEIISRRLPKLRKKKINQKPSAEIINLEEYANSILKNNQQTKELKWTKKIN